MKAGYFMALPPVLITDTKYRASLAAFRALGRAGFPLFPLQAKKESAKRPAAFYSKYARHPFFLEGSVEDPQYPARLKEACEAIKQKTGMLPVLFPIGAITLSKISENREALGESARFLVSPPQVLELANDKRRVAELARKLSIPLPEEYPCQRGSLPPKLPVVIKPRCGEKLGLHVTERYRKAYTEAEFRKAYREMTAQDPEAVVQELLSGDGAGVSVVMDQHSRPISILCHRRVREYPIAGGPSACCESIWDEELVRHAVALLQAMGFVGIAMVEFKGGKLLEINPRIWGSFPLTYACGSPFAECYVRGALGEALPLCEKPVYTLNKRMSFFFNDGLASFSYLRHGLFKKGLRGFGDLLNPKVRDGVFSLEDPKPFFIYLKNTFQKGTE